MTALARTLTLAMAGAALYAAPAHAEALHGGNWSGNLTGGTLKLGDGLLPPGTVAAGGSTGFTIPPVAGPVGFRLAGTRVNFLNYVREAANGTGDEYTASGALNLLPTDSQVDPASGNWRVTLTASGTITVTGRTLTQGQQTGAFSGICEVREAATPAPVPLSASSSNPGGQPWSLASGTVTLTDPSSPISVSCPNLPSRISSELIGSTDAGHNALSLGGALTPTDPGNVGNGGPPNTPGPPSGVTFGPHSGNTLGVCVVPNVIGKDLDAAKKAIKKAGCSVGRIRYRRSLRAASGTVMKQSPKALQVFKPGHHVRLTIAR